MRAAARAPLHKRTAAPQSGSPWAAAGAAWPTRSGPWWVLPPPRRARAAPAPAPGTRAPGRREGRRGFAEARRVGRGAQRGRRMPQAPRSDDSAAAAAAAAAAGRPAYGQVWFGWERPAHQAQLVGRQLAAVEVVHRLVVAWGAGGVGKWLEREWAAVCMLREWAGVRLLGRHRGARPRRQPPATGRQARARSLPPLPSSAASIPSEPAGHRRDAAHPCASRARCSRPPPAGRAARAAQPPPPWPPPPPPPRRRAWPRAPAPPQPARSAAGRRAS